jgi:5'-3' exonuclease
VFVFLWYTGRIVAIDPPDAGHRIFLVDGTYELFRHFFGAPSHVNGAGHEVAATRGVVSSMLGLMEEGAAYVGVATDHVIESFRNQMWPGYKTSAGVDPTLLGQFGLLEDALGALGVVVWAMVDLEADDALASAAAVAAADPEVRQVAICTPDKDLGQCVSGGRVVQVDRRKRAVIDEDGVRAKFGVGPASIPDWLALVGDSADGFPGLPGWGAKTAAAVLARYGHLEEIPEAPGQWDVPVRGAVTLAATLSAQRDRAMLFRDLATLRTEPPVIGSVAELRWGGPGPEFTGLCEKVLDGPGLVRRAEALARRRA